MAKTMRVGKLGRQMALAAASNDVGLLEQLYYNDNRKEVKSYVSV